MVRFIVVFLALIFLTGMIYFTAADFAENGVTGLGIVGAVAVGIMTIGTVGSFLHPPRRTNERDQPVRRAQGRDDEV
jgi:hypothetical protein